MPVRSGPVARLAVTAPAADPKSTLSVPGPPISVSLPPCPSSVSLPPLPQMTSSPAVPVRTSLPAVPEIVPVFPAPKVAVTDRLADIATVHVVALPLHAPDQPVNVELACAAAVRTTVAPGVNAAELVAPDEMPAGLLVTVPVRHGLGHRQRRGRCAGAHREGVGPDRCVVGVSNRRVEHADAVHLGVVGACGEICGDTR